MSVDLPLVPSYAPAEVQPEYGKIRSTITLQETVLFGTAWPGMDMFGFDIPFRNGWSKVLISRVDDGGFLFGVTEKLDAHGRVTDVVLAFQGHQPGNNEIFTMFAGLENKYVERAVAMYDQIFTDPRYENTAIHVTGHSGGAVMTSWMLAHSLATYGTEATDARADFIGFASPPWTDQAMTAHGLPLDSFDGRFDIYMLESDYAQFAGSGENYAGTMYVMEERAGSLAPPVSGLIESHWWNTYSLGLGLPDWMTAEEQQAVFQKAGVTSAEDYVEPGMAELIARGDDADNHLTGQGAGDTFIGGLGRDFLTGNGGDDVFRFERLGDSGASRATADVITDFTNGDLIDLSQIDAIHVPIQLRITTMFGSDLVQFLEPNLDNESFTFIGSNAFTGAGQVRSTLQGNTTWVEGDINGDLLADFAIQLQGRHLLEASDFIL